MGVSGTVCVLQEWSGTIGFSLPRDNSFRYNNIDLKVVPGRNNLYVMP